MGVALSSKWIATIDAALNDPRSADYDKVIAGEVIEYDTRFKATPGYAGLKTPLFKAMLLVESGGPSSPAWSSRPMQIGNAGDPGYGVLRGHQMNSDIIMSAQLQADIAAKPINDPTLNVRAGMALAMTMAAQFRSSSQIDSSDPSMHVHKVVKGDSLSRISRTETTTVQDIKASNPAASLILHPGKSVNFHRAFMVANIAGWRIIDAQFLADRYNGGGDPGYFDKISYCLGKLK